MQPIDQFHTDMNPESARAQMPNRAPGTGALAVEARFVRALIGMNLASAMEYRASFLTQIVFMFVNNGIYFVFWLLFFERFGNVGGYVIHDVYLLFAVVAMGFGLGTLLAGNTGQRLAYLIAQGRLDYYLVLPRPVLLHVLFSHMTVASFGDVAFGLLALGFSGYHAPVELGFYGLAVVAVALIYTGYMTLAGSLAFFFGNAEYVSAQLNMAMLTFSLYPHGLFGGGARLLLYTLLPASFIGSVPVALIQARSLGLLAGLWGVALVSCAVGAIVFAYGLRRYESGSALNVNV
ncbi:MAG: ABC-2 family transporter protein [Litorilinea sp.]